MSAQRQLLTLGVALVFIGSAFHLFTASLPLYFADLGFDPTAIGLLIGAAAVAELFAAFGVGPSVDRFGGRALLLAGAATYVVASLGYSAFAAIPALILFRALQGFGIAAVVPSSYSYVPHLVPPRRQTVAFASLGVASNVAMAVCPPLGLFLLEELGPKGLFYTAAAAAAIGIGIALLVPAPTTVKHPLRLTFRRAWLTPLLVNSLIVVQWGVIVAFLPLNAREAGSNPGLLFTADAIAVLASRIPAGWAADRFGPLRLALGGVVATVLSVALLLTPLTDATLILSGALNGLGGGLVLPPMLAQLSLRSDDRTRGTALSYFNISFALAFILGSSIGGILYGSLGFQGLLVAAAAICASASIVALRDPVLAQPTRGAAGRGRAPANPGPGV